MVPTFRILESESDRIIDFCGEWKGKGFLSLPPSPLPPPHAVSISGLLALIIQEEDPVTRVEPEEEEVLLTNMAAKYQTDQVLSGLQVPTFDEYRYRYLLPGTILWNALYYTKVPMYSTGKEVLTKS